VKRIIPAAMALAAAVALAGCGTTQSGPSVTACKAAMKAEYAAALSTGKQGTEPSACKGLPSSTLTALAGQILSQGS
jgi:hypothetical protein